MIRFDMKLEIYSASSQSDLAIPYVDGGVYAGFPSPAQDFMENSIDLNRDLVLHPESTFYARVVGDSMVEADVEEGDILVVDKSLDVKDGIMAVCILNGEFTVKYLHVYDDHIELVPANSSYKSIRVSESDDFEVWGTVTYVIKRMSNT